jgi:hypothetical protein
MANPLFSGRILFHPQDSLFPSPNFFALVKKVRNVFFEPFMHGQKSLSFFWVGGGGSLGENRIFLVSIYK